MPRFSHTETKLADGRVLLAVGQAVGGVALPVDTVQVFDPWDDMLTTTGTSSAGRHNHHVVRLTVGPDAGKALIFGGRNQAGGWADT
jgi:hypothetical protein